MTVTISGSDPTRGLGIRSQDPAQAYWNSLRPTLAKASLNLELWLE